MVTHLPAQLLQIVDNACVTNHPWTALHAWDGLTTKIASTHDANLSRALTVRKNKNNTVRGAASK
jgi:hypothetical protein